MLSTKRLLEAKPVCAQSTRRQAYDWGIDTLSAVSSNFVKCTLHTERASLALVA